MDDASFYRALYAAEFPQRYYALCNLYPMQPNILTAKGKKDEVIALFAAAGVSVKYFAHGRVYDVPLPDYGSMEFGGAFMIQRYGPELTLYFNEKYKNYSSGSNMCAIAHRCASLFHPNLIPNPPYPRPYYNNDFEKLGSLIKDFVDLLKYIRIHFIHTFSEGD